MKHSEAVALAVKRLLELFGDADSAPHELVAFAPGKKPLRIKLKKPRRGKK